MIKKLLIANRGEIARRIIKTASKMGIYTVSIYTSDENNAPWTKEANESVLLGEGGVAETYGNIVRILQIAKENNCDAIHPGYGFLSENYEFSNACEKENITFIGPKSDVIKLMGNKNKAREFVNKINIPIPKGITGSVTEILANIDPIDFPVLIKAVGGGGGKGMYIANTKQELPELLKKASSEAEKWFGNKDVYIEQYFNDARHIEVQVLADNFGNFIHLFERECTLQRNYQKIIEEAPSPTLNELQRNEIAEAALKIAKESKYTNAGTIEFLWQNGKFYFLEMNTRIQVEHPVSELITDIDIVEQQINIANNFKLILRQKDINIIGHAIQARIYAENPFENFKPSAGYINYYHETKTKNIRFDSTYTSECEVSTRYDGLLSKVIAHGKDRPTTTNLLNKVLSNIYIHGIEHNISYLKALLKHKNFTANLLNTQFIKENHNYIIKDLEEQTNRNVIIAIAAYIASSYIEKSQYAWSDINFTHSVKQYNILVKNIHFNVMVYNKHSGFILSINGKENKFSFVTKSNNKIELSLNNSLCTAIVTTTNTAKIIQVKDYSYKVSSQNKLNEVQIVKKQINNNSNKINEVASPLHGTISEISAKQGQLIEQGDKLLVIESMKTENQILSPGNGIVEKILFNTNDKVKENDILVLFKN